MWSDRRKSVPFRSGMSGRTVGSIAKLSMCESSTLDLENHVAMEKWAGLKFDLRTVLRQLPIT